MWLLQDQETKFSNLQKLTYWIPPGVGPRNEWTCVEDSLSVAGWNITCGIRVKAKRVWSHVWAQTNMGDDLGV